MATTSVVAMALLGLPFGQALAAPQEAPREGLTVRLLDPPADPEDVRARVYIVGHHEPGDVVERTLEIGNGYDEPLDVDLLVADARAEDDWLVEDTSVGEVAAWTTFDPPGLVVPPGQWVTSRVRIAVPADAAGGERHAALVAAPAVDGSGVRIQGRVGIRVYLSVGGPEAPPSDFTIDALQPLRTADGEPAVRIHVTNTGERVLDIVGRLWLQEGPGGLSVDPVPVSLGRTLGAGFSGTVDVVLAPEIPAGPWTAVADLSGGPVRRQAEARITFPDPAGTADPATGEVRGDLVDAVPFFQDRGRLIPFNLVLLGLAMLGALAWWVTDRRGAVGQSVDARVPAGGSDPENPADAVR